MTNPGNSPESSNTEAKGFKVTLMQGIIGAITLAATTAIPILVQQALSPQPPVVPAQITPITTPANSSIQAPATSADQPSVESGAERNGDRKDRKKKD